MSASRNHAGPFCQRLYLPEARIEKTCRDALESVELLPEYPEPIRIDRFIDRFFGMEEEYEDLPEQVMGCARFTKDGLTAIVINRSLAEDPDPIAHLRVRSTLAHEAGHGLFHQDLFVEKLKRDETQRLLEGAERVFESVTSNGFACRAEFGMRSVPRFEWWEYQANRAMACLLLPWNLVLQAARERLPIVLAERGTLEQRISEAEREIARLFDVSRQMVAIRLDGWWAEQLSQPSLL